MLYPVSTPRADVHKTINLRAFSRTYTYTNGHKPKSKHSYLKSLKNTYPTCFTATTHRWKCFANTKGIKGILILHQCVGSRPLTPHVNGFYSISETELCLLSFFFCNRFIFKNATTATPCVNMCSPGTLNTQTSTDTQQSNSETQLPLSSSQLEISDMTRRSRFVSWACLLSGGRGSLRLL